MPLGRMPTIPEYYRERINAAVDLISERKQCCPFHKEDTPSFSYQHDKKRWRCFGACKTGGDVIELHRKNYKLASREEARVSLMSLYGVTEKVELTMNVDTCRVDSNKVEFERLYQLVLLHANIIERWLAMDYAMSKYPVDQQVLKDLLEEWEVSYDKRS